MEKPYDFRKKLLRVHKPGVTDPAVCGRIRGTRIDGTWTVAIPNDAGAVLRHAAADLAEYFAVSLGVRISVSASSADPKRIEYRVDPELGVRTYRIECGENIILAGCDERHAAKAGYALEDALDLNRGPVLETGTFTFKSRFSPRIIHSGMGIGMYPDEHLRLLAHYGYDCIPVQSQGVLDDEAKRREINDLIERAAGYGIDTYTIPPFKNGMHPDDAGAFEYYDNMYGRLVSALPGLKMILIVGECCEFPSKDERTTGRPYTESFEDEKPSPGWFPCRDYPEFVSLLNKVIRRRSPECELVFWTYNWGYESRELREELMRNVPEDITMMSTFEMFEQFDIKPDVRETCTDYTLWNIGPGRYFASESKIARERGLRMLSMTNTGGNTWDIGDVPFIPAPQRWIERFDAVIDAQNDMKLDGLMESHTYGFWPSVIPKLAKYAFTEPRTDLNVLLRRLTESDFGPDAAEAVMKAYALFGEAMAHCVPTNEDQYGPARVGPSYPLVFERPVSIPAGPGCDFSPDREANPIYRYNLDLAQKLKYEADEYAEVSRLYSEGLSLLEKARDDAHADAFDELIEIAGFIRCTARTIEHVKRWHLLKGSLGIYLDTTPIWVGGRKHMPDAVSAVKPLIPVKDEKPVIEELIRIAEAELENAEEALVYSERNSRIGYTQELGYCAAPEQIKWKLGELKKVIRDELIPRL